jgi:hypothetical protein
MLPAGMKIIVLCGIILISFFSLILIRVKFYQAFTFEGSDHSNPVTPLKCSVGEL